MMTNIICSYINRMVEIKVNPLILTLFILKVHLHIQILCYYQPQNVIDNHYHRVYYNTSPTFFLTNLLRSTKKRGHHPRFFSPSYSSTKNPFPYTSRTS